MARIQPVDLGVDPTDLDQPMRVELGVGRLTAKWDVTDDLPAGFQVSYDEGATPWNTAAPLVVPSR